VCLQFDDAHKLIVGHPELAGAGILVEHLGLKEQGVTPEQFLAVRAECSAAIYMTAPTVLYISAGA